jgi:hypothetical protein
MYDIKKGLPKFVLHGLISSFISILTYVLAQNGVNQDMTLSQALQALVSHKIAIGGVSTVGALLGFISNFLKHFKFKN